MQFTGKSLEKLRTGIDYAIDALHTEIGLNIGDLGYDEAEAEEDIVYFKKLLERIDRAIAKEKAK